MIVHARPTRTTTISLAELGDQLDNLRSLIGEGSTRILIEQGGSPVAALVSTADLERLAWFELEEQRQAEEDWAAIARLQARNADQNPDEVLAEATTAVEEARREIYEEQQRAAARRR